jgi:hypothetical protein
MIEFPAVIKNIYLRVLFGGYCILLGVIFLKVHLDRHKESIWGRIYRFGREGKIETQATGIGDKMYFILGCLSLAGGLIALIYGFRPTRVGG